MIALYYTLSNPQSEAFIKAAVEKYTSKKACNICYAENGKPFAEGICFSLSHTDGLTVCAVSETEVGADCEKVRSIKNKERIVSRFLKTDGKNLSDEGFFKEWTAFESRVKLFGEGIGKFSSANIPVATKTIVLGEFIVSVSSKLETEIVKENLYGSF